MEKAQLALAGIALGIWLGAVVINDVKMALAIALGIDLALAASEITKYL